MRRPQAAKVKREIERAAIQAVEGTVAQGAPPGDLSGTGEAGRNDPGSGNWLGYGLLDLDPLSTFRLAP